MKTFVQLGDEDGLAQTWNTDWFVIKQDKIKETTNWLEAMEIVFDRFNFSDSDFFDDNELVEFKFSVDGEECKVYGKGYIFYKDDDAFPDIEDMEEELEEDEIAEKLFEKYYGDFNGKSEEIKSCIKEIIRRIYDELSLNNQFFIGTLFNELNIDFEKSEKKRGSKPKCYIYDPTTCSTSSFELVNI